MSKLDRESLKKLILKEFKMIGMAPQGGMMQGPGHKSSHEVEEDIVLPSKSHGAPGAGSVSRESCCEAVICLIECCSCPVTKQALMECCHEILSGRHDH